MTTKEVIIPLRVKVIINSKNREKLINIGQLTAIIKKGPTFLLFFYIAFKVFVLGVKHLMGI